ncbi:MAG: carboxynorspermidine decarboxylase [Bacteroidales bacterium]|jgi:carboxynorspermidine decarboxylase|nr:carboxynorspermidine decarboxylase [Bacteroidales bacterium]
MTDFSAIPSPCYVIEEQLLRNNLAVIRAVAQAADVEIILAFKGFAMWSVFPTVREYISGATASSLHEARLCAEKMGVRAHTYAPVYAPDEFGEIVRLSSYLTFNSLSQYAQLYSYAKTVANPPEIGLRINPEFSDVGVALYNPALPGSRLGITAEHLHSLPDGVTGLHFHTLCESSAEDLEKTLAVVEQKFGHLFPQIHWLNMGGGHLMTRKGYDTDRLITLLRSFHKKYPHIHIILEPGSAFAWETGFLRCTVLDIVENHGIKTAMLDVSFAAHMPDCLEMPYQPAIRGASMQPVANAFKYRMGGNSCLSGDWCGDWWFDRELHPGDDIILEDMIHYTMVKTTFFNGIRHPAIGIIHTDGRFKLVRRFGYDDYRNRLS